jgi:ABC-type lipoprotein release transport system permease subunit
MTALTLSIPNGNGADGLPALWAAGPVTMMNAGLLVGLAVVAVLAVAGKVPLAYNLRNLVVRWRTTVMTLLAFTAVVGVLVVMVAFVNGMVRLTEQSGVAANVIVLSDGSTDELMSNLAQGDLTDVERQPGVERGPDGRPLCSREVYVVVNQPMAVRPGEPPRRRFVQVRGVEDPALASAVHNLSLVDGGRWFSAAGVADDPAGGPPLIEAVLGEGVAGELARDQNLPAIRVGDTFDLGPRKWRVVGIMQSTGSTFGSEVWAKHTLVGSMFGKEQFTSLVLRTSDAQTARSVADDLTKNYKKAALAAFPETEYFEQLSQTNVQFLFAIIFVTVFMAAGGVFGVMNTMFAAISQRTKDIGVLRILGFSRWQVLFSFFIESLFLALAGGALGCFVGWLSDGWTATSIVSSNTGGGKFVVLELDVTLATLSGGMLLALAMGAIGGLLPALSATRLRPLESLK